MTQADYSLTKLRWGCRRGMLELDVLLGNFLNSTYSALSLDEKRRFAALLTYPDPVLYAWLMGYQEVEEQEMVALVAKIRSHVHL